MPKTDLHKELIKLKSKSNLNINLDFDPNKIESDRLFHIDDIKKICETYNLFLMEDNCDAFSSKYGDDFTGTFGDVSTLSFYPAHHITTGEGGAVCTSNTKLKKIELSVIEFCNPSTKTSSNFAFKKGYSIIESPGL